MPKRKPIRTLEAAEVPTDRQAQLARKCIEAVTGCSSAEAAERLGTLSCAEVIQLAELQAKGKRGGAVMILYAEDSEPAA